MPEIWDKLHQYSRIDGKAKTIPFIRKTVGPRKDAVYARTCINLDTGNVLEDKRLMIDLTEEERNVPITDFYGNKRHARIRTILYYDPKWYKPTGRFVDGRWTRFYAGSRNPGVWPEIWQEIAKEQQEKTIEAFKKAKKGVFSDNHQRLAWETDVAAAAPAKKFKIGKMPLKNQTVGDGVAAADGQKYGKKKFIQPFGMQSQQHRDKISLAAVPWKIFCDKTTWCGSYGDGVVVNPGCLGKAAVARPVTKQELANTPKAQAALQKE